MMWLLIIPVLYVTLIICYINAWKRIPFFYSTQTNTPSITESVAPSPSGRVGERSEINISIIIATRNEENYIAPLLQSLIAQHYPKNLYELIFINDHSDDATVLKIENTLKKTDVQFTVISLPENESGKKAAIAAGIKQAKGTLIITTDADCSMGTQWLKTIAQFYQTHKPSMIVMPVALTGDNFLSRLQAQEFLSLTGVTGASLALKKPLMCNGANLAFEKTAYQNVNKEALRNDIATGDDTFLMLHIFKTYPEKVMYVKSADVLVTTPAQKNVAAFLSQRIRWTSKVKLYSEWYISIIGLLVVLMAALQVFSFSFLVFCLASTGILLWMVIVFILKMAVDYFLIKQTSSDLKQPFSVLAFICWQFLYPFYILITGISALFGGYEWKGRIYQ